MDSRAERILRDAMQMVSSDFVKAEMPRPAFYEKGRVDCRPEIPVEVGVGENVGPRCGGGWDDGWNGWNWYLHEVNFIDLDSKFKPLKMSVPVV